MNSQKFEENLQTLNQRLRILILQNVGENMSYDENFLREMRELSDQILHLKQALGSMRQTYKKENLSAGMNRMVAHS